ncbi:MAG: 50S ribosomal protein L24 [Thermoplasmata archaeon]|jgi:large subunit ribosomal protein L24|nr:50S ribosomal protein L24 [Thermoplasmata archaeon]MVT13801.1 50S ribosomal protein L24 [Euryarchaeota archaeon]MVT15206.1 50S ribosomal protein L24 [Euryarchaeota archaeon]MVT35686.1 50S ribosomal protein L24 [Euryarchaeota archaeon]
MVKPGKVRKELYNSPKHRREKIISSHVSDELYSRYGIRSIPVRKGDTVKIVRGNFKGFEGKVSNVDLKKMKINVEGVLINKADKKQKPRWIDASNVIITRLDLSDKLRLEKVRKVALMKNKVIEEGENVEQASKEIGPEQGNPGS